MTSGTKIIESMVAWLVMWTMIGGTGGLRFDPVTKFFDDYETEISAAVADGSIQIVIGVKLSGNEAAPNEVQLLVDEKPFLKTPMMRLSKASSSNFSSKICHSAKSVSYLVRLGSRSVYSPCTTSPIFRVSVDNDVNGTCKSGELLIRTKSGRRCGLPKQEECIQQHVTDVITCKSEDPSMCHSIAKKNEIKWLQHFHQCPNIAPVSIMDWNGQARNFDMIEMLKSMTFMVGCPPDSEMVNGTAKITVTSSNGTLIKNETFEPCTGFRQTTVDLISRADIIRFAVEAEKGMKRALTLSNLASFPKPDAYKATPNEDWTQVILGFSGELLKVFTATSSCNCGGQQSQKVSGYVVLILGSGSCVCNTTLTATSPLNPNKSISKDYTLKIEVLPTSTSRSWTESLWEPTWVEVPRNATWIEKLIDQTIGWKIALGLLLLLVAVLFAILGFLYCKRERKRRDRVNDDEGYYAARVRAETKTPHEELRRINRNSKPKETIESDLEEAEKTKKQDQGNYVEKTLGNVFKWIKDHVKQTDVIALKGCRYYNKQWPELLRYTQVVVKGVVDGCCLHMTELYDYYGDFLAVCQAPVPDQFFAHWMAIMENKVGVIAMLGQFVEWKIARKIHEYFSLTVGTTMEIKAGGEGRKFVIATEKKESVYNVFDIYTLKASLFDKAGMLIKQFTVKVMHVTDWPDFSVPKNLGGLCLALLRLIDLVLEMKSQGKPGLIIHCSAGLQRSISLITSYISLQAYLREKTTNVMGNLGFVMKKRLHALSPDLLGVDKVFAQLKLIQSIVVRCIELLHQAQPGLANPALPEDICTEEDETVGPKTTPKSVTPASEAAPSHKKSLKTEKSVKQDSKVESSKTQALKPSLRGQTSKTLDQPSLKQPPMTESVKTKSLKPSVHGQSSLKPKQSSKQGPAKSNRPT